MGPFLERCGSGEGTGAAPSGSPGLSPSPRGRFVAKRRDSGSSGGETSVAAPRIYDGWEGLHVQGIRVDKEEGRCVPDSLTKRPR